MGEVGVEAGQHEELQLGARGLPLVHLQEYHLGGGGFHKLSSEAKPKLRLIKILQPTFLPRMRNLSGNFLRRKGRSCWSCGSDR